MPQVLEHAFRHLSWLVKDDDAVRTALPDWMAFLGAYEPEPFRAFGAPGGGEPSGDRSDDMGGARHHRQAARLQQPFQPACALSQAFAQFLVFFDITHAGQGGGRDCRWE